MEDMTSEMTWNNSVWLFIADGSGVSSFNQFVYDLSVDSDESSSMDYSSGEEEMDENVRPSSPVSHSSRISRTGSIGRHNRRRICWIELMISWIFLPAKIFFYIPLHLFHLSYFRWVSSSDQTGDLIKRAQMLKESIIPRTTDRRRGIIEVRHAYFYNIIITFSGEKVSHGTV